MHIPCGYTLQDAGYRIQDTGCAMFFALEYSLVAEDRVHRQQTI
ncbi:MAG TPA: hypothetical protein VLH08_04610 [Acidobacteriota bacterium]|nr:hypothetical protein [Acidobacteriota bacterium]